MIRMCVVTWSQLFGLIFISSTSSLSTPIRFVQLYQSYDFVLNQRTFVDCFLQVMIDNYTLIGHVNRHRLSVCQYCDVFIVKCYKNPSAVWQSVQEELAVIRDVLIFALDLWGVPWSQMIYAYDFFFVELQCKAQFRRCSMCMRQIWERRTVAGNLKRKGLDSEVLRKSTILLEKKTRLEYWKRIHQNWSWRAATNAQWKLKKSTKSSKKSLSIYWIIQSDSKSGRTTTQQDLRSFWKCAQLHGTQSSDFRRQLTDWRLSLTYPDA